METIKIDLKDKFYICEEGTEYKLPEYKVVDGVGLEEVKGSFTIINFVRGSKLKDEEVPKRIGTLHEHMLKMMIHDLKYKNKLVSCRETSLVITKLEEAYNYLLQRQIQRIKDNNLNTYKL